MTSPTTPLPCPFCGGEPKVKEWPKERFGLRGNIEVSCEERALLMTNVISEENTIEEAIANWNHRAMPSESAFIEVGEMVEIPDGFDGHPNTVYCEWNEMRSKLPAGTKIYVRR